MWEWRENNILPVSGMKKRKSLLVLHTRKRVVLGNSKELDENTFES